MYAPCMKRHRPVRPLSHTAATPSPITPLTGCTSCLNANLSPQRALQEIRTVVLQKFLRPSPTNATQCSVVSRFTTRRINVDFNLKKKNYWRSCKSSRKGRSSRWRDRNLPRLLQCYYTKPGGEMQSHDNNLCLQHVAAQTDALNTTVRCYE